MATTATTNLMSLDTKPIKATSLSVRSSNMLQRQPNPYKNTSYDQKSFDKVFDKYNESTSSMSKDTQNIVSDSDSVQDKGDPISAAITKSAHGKSKNTQDAPQQNTESQPNEEVEEIEETEEPSNSNRRITTMNLFSFVSVSVEEQTFTPTNDDVKVEDNSNLLSILPQSQESAGKAQDMLNLLSGRTWKINQSAQSANQIQEQSEQLTENLFAERNFASLPNNQQQLNFQPQMQNQPISDNPVQRLNNIPVQEEFLSQNQPPNNAVSEMITDSQKSPKLFMGENPARLSNFTSTNIENLQSPGNLMQKPLFGASTMNQQQVPTQIQTTLVTPAITQNPVENPLNIVTDPTTITSSTDPEGTINLINSQENNNSQSQPQSQQFSSVQQEQVLSSELTTESSKEQNFDSQQSNLSQEQPINSKTNLQVQSVLQKQNVTQPKLTDENIQINIQNNNSTQPQIQNLNGSQLTEQVKVSIDAEQAPTNNDSQPSQIQLNSLMDNESKTQNISQSQSVTLTGTQNLSEVNNAIEQPIQQNQPQQVTYQPQTTQQPQNPQQVQQNQVQPATQLENIEIPQVQAVVLEIQPEINNRQSQNQQNISNLIEAEAENNNLQQINPSQQTAQQQQPQNQQQSMQSQTQQSATSENESTANSFENNQQPSSESFSAHLGAAVHNTNNQPQNNVSNAPLNQMAQTAQTDENITAQIVEHARMIRNAQNTEMVIQLKPEHLGELTLRVSTTTNGSVNVTFHSENAQVRAMIENTMVQLKNELSNQGLKVDNVQVSAHLSDGGMMNGRGQQAWEQNQRGNNNSRIGRAGRINGGNNLTAAEEAEVISASVVENVVSADGVDYRV